MQSWHLTFSAEHRGSLFPSEALRRAALQAIARVAGDRMVLFCLVDDHVHIVLLADAADAGRLARALLLALRSIVSVSLGPAHRRPVEGRSHLEYLVRYCLTQPVKHGIDRHPALWTGSCFLDLVGARALPGLRLQLSETLPRLRQRSLFEQVGLSPAPLQPVDDPRLRELGATRIVAAAASVLAAAPELRGNRADVALARCIAAQLGLAAGLPTSELVWALDITRQGARRLVHRPVEPALLRAARLRLALEDRVAAAPLLLGEPALPWGVQPGFDATAEPA